MRVAALIRSGDLCKRCGSKCGKDYQESPVVVGCPVCNEIGCDLCEEGYFRLEECPRDFLGFDLIESINIASLCGSGDWPNEKGLLNQSCWLVNLKQSLEAEQSRIHAEKLDGGS